MPDKLYAVIVEHTADNCPLVQPTSEAALKLADNLDKAQAHGVFSMKLHHGVDLIKAASPEGLVKAYADILPRHDPATVIEVTGDEWLQGIYDDPERLDDDEDLRLDLLDYMAKQFEGFDLRATRQQGLPTNSLRRLPAYLREHAPVA